MSMVHTVAAAYGEGISPFLLFHGVEEMLVAGKQHCTADAPHLLCGVDAEELVGEECFMSAVEVADSYVQDAGDYVVADIADFVESVVHLSVVLLYVAKIE